MYKTAIIYIAFFLSGLKVFAADFSPAPLTITGQDMLVNNYNGNDLIIPITITGTPASVWLVINTRDLAVQISNVRNGYLGWHYVNKIDTTVYISGRYEKAPGESNVVWNYRDENGNLVNYTSNYSYCLWAYDSKTPRQKACSFISTGYGIESQFVQMVEKGPDGKPLAKPLLFGSQVWQGSQIDPNAADYSYKAHGTVFKWTIGYDPDDITMLQTTRCPGYSDTATNNTYGSPILNPTNFNIFYHSAISISEKRGSLTTIMKWQFVPGGIAINDITWGNWENVTLEDHGATDIWSQKPSCYTDGNYIYQVSPGLNLKAEEWNKLRVYNFDDGSVIMDKMMHEWYMPEDKNPKGLINASFDKMYSRNQYGSWLLISHYSCMHEMINTTRLVTDQDDETDMIMWRNSNGDYFLDTAYSPAYEPQWYCLTDDKTDTMRPSSASIDRNGFNIIGVSYYGLTSFAVSSQDGTGIGVMQFADDKPGNEKFPKLGGVICDNGSAYDGLYFAGVEPGNDTWVPVEKRADLQSRKAMSATIVNTSYVAFDSFRGVIRYNGMMKDGDENIISTAENNPASFSVCQNSPNPFNPSTSIDIDLPSRNTVKAEVFNVTGSKVAVLADGIFNTGRYRLKWDAGGFSAGVYFCRISYGMITKTIRMTLVK